MSERVLWSGGARGRGSFSPSFLPPLGIWAELAVPPIVYRGTFRYGTYRMDRTGPVLHLRYCTTVVPIPHTENLVHSLRSTVYAAQSQESRVKSQELLVRVKESRVKRQQETRNKRSEAAKQQVRRGKSSARQRKSNSNRAHAEQEQEHDVEMHVYLGLLSHRYGTSRLLCTIVPAAVV